MSKEIIKFTKRRKTLGESEDIKKKKKVKRKNQ